MKTGHNPGVPRGAAGPDSPGAAMLDRYPAMLPLLSTQQPGMSHPRLGASIIFTRGGRPHLPASDGAWEHSRAGSIIFSM